MNEPVTGLATSVAVYRRLLGYSMRYWPMGLLALVGMAFDAACGSLFTFSIKPMLDDLFVRKDATIIFWMPIFIVGLFLVRGLATFTADYGIARIGRSVVMILREEVFGKYLRLPAAHFGREPSGRMISRMTYTVEQVANASTDALKVVVLDGLMVLGQITVMLLISVRLTLALFVLAPLVGSVVWFVGKRYRAINRRIQDSISSVTGIVDEAVNGFREVKVYGGRYYETKRFARINSGIRHLNLKVAVTNALSTSTVQLVAAIALALVIFLATRPPTLDEMSPGSFMALITAMMVMLPSMKRLTTVQANLGRGIVAARDIFEVIDAPDEVDDGDLDVERVHGDIEFRNISFSYPGANATALHEISLHCAPGTVTALVGRSGGGKSSLVSLLPRFHDVDHGTILIDGLPLGDYKLASLRSQIGLVSQNVVLFDDSIANNIAYGSADRVSASDIHAAAAAAHVLEFADKLEGGLNAPVGQGGSRLSGGQRQRIAIARALLKDAPILILDEATSALDSESERLIQDALKRLMHERTVLVIAHRLSTVTDADQIVVMDEGRIIERGSHAELLARDGYFSALHRMQFHDQPT